ncbi:MAG TPA: GNAT family protein [Pyrinomonadaceae bacterium]|nr:GNAT family protein [Pyrinomonadaceae bacterium]
MIAEGRFTRARSSSGQYSLAMRQGLPAQVPDFMVRIETERLLLRMFRPDDLDDLAAMFQDPDVVRYVGDGKPVDREGADRALQSIIKHWETHGFGRWAVEDKQTGEFVGFGGLRSLFGMPEVVYHLVKAHWGKGFASELAHAALRFGFEDRGFEKIVAIAKPLNAASIHVMDKLGMKFEKNATYYDIDVVQYGITREEFKPGDSDYQVLPNE